MPILNCYVDDATLARLNAASRSLGRSVEDLAESAIAEAALKEELAYPSNMTCVCGITHKWEIPACVGVASARCACGRDITSMFVDPVPAPAEKARAAKPAKSPLPTYEDALAVVREAGKVSPSLIQRKLQIGYNLAMSFVHQMQAEGVCYSPDAAGRRALREPT